MLPRNTTYIQQKTQPEQEEIQRETLRQLQNNINNEIKTEEIQQKKNSEEAQQIKTLTNQNKCRNETSRISARVNKHMKEKGSNATPILTNHDTPRH